SVQFENPNLSFEDFYLMGPILPENPSHLLVFSNEDDETGTYSFAASRRAQDGLVSFENSQVTLLLTTTANIVEPFDVIINEVAYSTLGEIVVNPEIIVSFVHLVSIETGGIDIPIAYGLEQNFPNPFNPTTSITYHVPKSGEIRLSVFDMLGREVAVVVNGTVNAGTHTVNVDGRSLSSGMYIYRLQAGNQVITRKMTLVK
ncbi:MAG: T9SS type A sorting domain-containing protein, partial [Balneolales bacterium]|nr:T9SS type A sorting domain-containing protein [Balneolales bacterium]